MQSIYVASDLDTQIHYVFMLEFNTKTMQLLLHGLSKVLAQHVHFTCPVIRPYTHTLKNPNNKLTTW